MKTPFLTLVIMLFAISGSLVMGQPVALAGESGDGATTQPDQLSAGASVLITKHFVVIIIDQRQEGDADNSQVIYLGVNKSTGESIRLIGSTLHSKARDGTPGMFQGYNFQNGDVTYTVLESGALEVVRGDSNVLVDEQGTWVQ